MPSPFEKPPIAPPTPKLTPAMTAALKLMLKAQETADDLRHDKTDFALEIHVLMKEASVSSSDLRALLCQGYAEHLVEKTPPQSKRRAFRKMRSLRLLPDSWRTGHRQVHDGLHQLTGPIDEQLAHFRRSGRRAIHQAHHVFLADRRSIFAGNDQGPEERRTVAVAVGDRPAAGGSAAEAAAGAGSRGGVGGGECGDARAVAKTLTCRRARKTSTQEIGERVSESPKPTPSPMRHAREIDSKLAVGLNVERRPE